MKVVAKMVPEQIQTSMITFESSSIPVTYCRFVAPKQLFHRNVLHLTESALLQVGPLAGQIESPRLDP